MFLSEHICLGGVVALTESGTTPRFLSRFRSHVPIYAFTRHEDVRRRMVLMRGVFPMRFDSRGLTPREAARATIRLLVECGCMSPGIVWCSRAASIWKRLAQPIRCVYLK